MEQATLSVRLPSRLKEEIDELVYLGIFNSRTDAIKFGARLVVMMERGELPISKRAEEFAFKEIKAKFKRLGNVS